MMKKRKSPAAKLGDNEDDTDSEMVDVGGEEKMETTEDSDNDDDEFEKVDEDDASDDEEEEDERDGTVQGNSFMDSFYALSSSNPVERSQAASTLLHHCLVGPQANSKDAAYAFRRLLNGVCSGRAASRQGNASALASFLKLSFEGGQLEEIKNQDNDAAEEEDNAENVSILAYVRNRLLKATDPTLTQGKKKGSEERDYQFGRLFGILSVARSGILLPSDKKDCDTNSIKEVATGFVSDLVELYNDKKWMREPSARAIATILETFYEDSEGKAVAIHLVQEVVIPKLLLGDDTDGSFDINNCEAEKIAVAATIQSHVADHPDGMPDPLDKPTISPETMPIIVKVLVETSSVTVPRTHLVWDSLWMYLMESSTKAPLKKTNNRPIIRELRKELLMGGNSSRDIIDSLVQNVILEGLLRVDIATEKGAKATHEKRALALCLVRNLFGVPFNSSITGPTQIVLESEDLERILTPVMIRRLFLDVICAGGGSAKKAHTLKPLALQILASMVSAMSQDISELGMTRRLKLAKAFVQCEPRFDSLTKTTTISDLVGFSNVGGDTGELGTPQRTSITSYFDFLKEKVLLSSEETEGDVLGYIDTLYQGSKRLLLLSSGDGTKNTETVEFVLKTVEGVVGFLMASSFFDCGSFVDDKAGGSAKKKSKKSKGKAGKRPLIVEVAAHINELGKQREPPGPLSFAVRSILAERFYSLLAEYTNTSVHSGVGTSTGKDSALLDTVQGMCSAWKTLETGGAKPLFPAIKNKSDEDEDEAGDSKPPEEIVSHLQSLANDMASVCLKNPDDMKLRAKKRCATGCAALVSALFLHLLGCGRPEDLMDEDDVTTEDDDDSADIIDAIEAIGEFVPLILDGVEDDNKENPLAGFAEVCVEILSSRISSANPGRGASPRLLRDAVKFAWMGVLSASATLDRNLLDADVIEVLFTGIGANKSDKNGDEVNEMDEEEDGGDDSDEEDDDNELGDFSKVGNILDDDDDEGSSDDDKPDQKSQEAENDEEEIDKEKLNSLLEDDSDADVDVGELEHHEGADAALAMLIKMRQEARKSTRQARERFELENQVRCTLLLETLLGKSDSWASLFRSDIVLMIAFPLLSYRNMMEKSLSKSAGEAKGSSAKKAMLEKLSSILKTKLFKLKLTSMPSTESIDMLEYCSALASSFMDMVRGSNSRDQRGYCSSALAMVLKAIPDPDSAMKVASIYSEAVEEWSTKRTTRLEVSLFDDLIAQCPSLSQIILVQPLISAATGARNAFLRCESLRLLSSLFNYKLNPKSSELDTLAMTKMQGNISQTVACICAMLKDEEMLKAKRVRDVLKATEKVLDFAKSSSCSVSNLDELSQVTGDLDANVRQNQGAKSALDKIEKLMEEIRQEPTSNDPMNIDDTVDKEDNNVDDDQNPNPAEEEDRDVDDKKSKQKKKKKKKRGKK